MARSQRDLSSSTWFHVFNRGADRQDIFSTDADHELFEELIGDAVEHHPVEIHAYAQMTNHFHLLLNCPDGRLSDFVQRACGRYGAAYNQRSGREGPLVTGRFKAKPITDDDHLLVVARYIHRNPLALVPKGKLVQYPWSSLASFCGARVAPEWLADDTVSRGGMNPSAYLEFVVTDLPSDACGDPHTVRRSASPVELLDVDRSIASALGRTSDELRQTTRGRTNIGRTLAITLAVGLRVARQEAIASWYGLSDVRSVRRIARRGRVLVARNPEISALYAEARCNLAPSGV